MLPGPMRAPLRRRPHPALLGLLALGALAAVPALAAAPPSSVATAQAEGVERAIGLLRIAIGAAALLLWAAGFGARRASRAGRSPASSGIRRFALATLAALALAANYNFFVWTGLHKHELYHYYLGSKYFPELGYFRLYECSVQALASDGQPLPAGLTEITDLRSKRRRPAAEVLAAARPCREDFTPARWAAFQHDVGVFRRLMGEDGFTNALLDHGYNPSPVWTLVGRPLASLAPATPAGLWMLARMDLWLLVALFSAIGWAFGSEALFLAAIAWGACGHTRYQWTGGAFLRQMWLATSIAAICLAHKGRDVAAGALLTLASLERVFPVLFFAGYGLGQLRRLLRERRLERRFVRFASGAALAACVLAGAGTAVAGRGVGVWREFAANLAAMTAFTPRNGLGLEYLLAFTKTPPAGVVVPDDPEALETVIQDTKRATLASRRWLYYAALAGFAALFVRAAWADPGRLEAWEAIAMGAFLIPVLTMPASYYFGFALAAAPLATRRPRIGSALLIAVLGSSLGIAGWGTGATAFAVSSFALLVCCAWTLLELQLPVDPA
jgi:hypothetical protein